MNKLNDIEFELWSLITFIYFLCKKDSSSLKRYCVQEILTKVQVGTIGRNRCH